MELSVIFAFCLFAFVVTTTQARSLVGESSRFDPRESDSVRAFEAKFLEKLGMKKKPRARPDIVVPQYMWDLYNSRVRDPDYVSTNLVFKDFATTANTIRAFHPKDAPHTYGNVNRSKRRIYLDTGTVPSHEELVKAEFRVYSNRSSADSALGQHIINIYQILASGVRKLLDSKVVNVTSIGWQTYDILQAVKHWHNTPDENHGLELDIVSENGHPIDISHLNFDKPSELDEKQWPHQRPILALFSRDPNTHHHKKRVRRSPSSHSQYKGLCKRFDLVVDFEKHLNWDWIYSPPSYNAYMCQGKCVYPIASHLNTTNHGIVQTLVHSVKKYRDTVPPACCVPTELESTMLLFADEHGGIEVKDYPDMMVIGCGCR